MSEKGTLCHATTRCEWCEGISRLPGLVLLEGGGGGGEGLERGLEGEEKAFGVFLSGNKLCIVFPYVNLNLRFPVLRLSQYKVLPSKSWKT